MKKTDVVNVCEIIRLEKQKLMEFMRKALGDDLACRNFVDLASVGEFMFRDCLLELIQLLIKESTDRVLRDGWTEENVNAFDHLRSRISQLPIEDERDDLLKKLDDLRECRVSRNGDPDVSKF